MIQQKHQNEFVNQNTDLITNKLATLFLSISESDILKKNFLDSMHKNNLNNFPEICKTKNNDTLDDQKLSEDINQKIKNIFDKNSNSQFNNNINEEERFQEFISLPEKNLNFDKFNFNVYEREKLEKFFEYSQEFYEMLSKNNYLAFAIKDDLSDYSISIANLISLKCEDVVKDVYLTNYSLIKKLCSNDINNCNLSDEKFNNLKVFLVKNKKISNEKKTPNKNGKTIKFINYSHLVNQLNSHSKNDKGNWISLNGETNNSKQNLSNLKNSNYIEPVKKKKRYRRTKLEIQMGISHKNKGIEEKQKFLKQNDKKEDNIKILNSNEIVNNKINKKNLNKKTLIISNSDNVLANSIANNNSSNLQNNTISNNLLNNESSRYFCYKDNFSSDSINPKNFFDEELNNELETDKLYFQDEFFHCVDILEGAENKQSLSFNLLKSKVGTQNKTIQDTIIPIKEEVLASETNLAALSTNEVIKDLLLKNQENEVIKDPLLVNQENEVIKDPLLVNHENIISIQNKMDIDNEFKEIKQIIFEEKKFEEIKTNNETLDSIDNFSEIHKELEKMKNNENTFEKEQIFQRIITNHNIEILNIDYNFIYFREKLLKFIYNHSNIDIFKDPISKRLIFPLLDILYIPVTKNENDLETENKNIQNHNENSKFTQNNLKMNVIDFDRYIEYTPKNYNEGESTIFFLSYLIKEKDFEERLSKTFRIKNTEKDPFLKENNPFFIENQRSFNTGKIDIFSNMTTANFNFFNSIAGQLIYDSISTPLGIAVNTLNNIFYSGCLIPNIKSNRFISLNRNFNLILPFSNPAVISLTRLYLGIQKNICLYEKSENKERKNNFNKKYYGSMIKPIPEEKISNQILRKNLNFSNDKFKFNKGSNNHDEDIIIGIKCKDSENEITSQFKIFEIQKVNKIKMINNACIDDIEKTENQNIFNNFASLENNSFIEKCSKNNAKENRELNIKNKNLFVNPEENIRNSVTLNLMNTNLNNNLNEINYYERRNENNYSNNSYVGIIWNRDEINGKIENHYELKKKDVSEKLKNKNINYSKFCKEKFLNQKTRKFINEENLFSIQNCLEKIEKKYEKIDFNSEIIRIGLKQKLNDLKNFKLETNELINKVRAETTDENKINNLLNYLKKKRNRKFKKEK